MADRLHGNLIALHKQSPTPAYLSSAIKRFKSDRSKSERRSAKGERKREEDCHKTRGDAAGECVEQWEPLSGDCLAVPQLAQEIR